MSTSIPIRVLFLHGMFCPPEGYELHLMPDLLKKLREIGCQVTFIESERISKSTPPTILEHLMPSQVDRLKAGNVPEWYNARDLDDDSGLKSLDGLATALAHLHSFISAQEEAFDIVMGHSGHSKR